MSEDQMDRNANSRNVDNQPVFRSRHEEHAARRQARREARGAGAPWIIGIGLIILGLIFIAQNAGLMVVGNWWALFILLPAAGAFISAWNMYRTANGRLTAAARGSLIGGLVLTFIAAMVLFSLNWGVLWPVFIILGGLGVLLNALVPGA